MAQLEEAAAGVEAEVVETAPESQGVDTTQTETPTDAEALYQEDQPEDDDVDLDDEGEEEEQDPAVVAPASLKPEEKEQFAQLPPEAQRMLSETLARRDRETQQGLEAARTAQREAEVSAADKVAQATQAHAQQLRALVNEFAPKPPPIEMARTNPGEYQYQKALFDQDMADYTALVGNIEGIGGQSAQHFQQREQQETVERIKGLMNIPEFANTETRPQLINSVEKHGIEYLGYDLDRLAQMDATDLRALMKSQKDAEDAQRWRAHQKRRNERPRQAGGKFAAAPAGAASNPQTNAQSVAQAMYPND